MSNPKDLSLHTMECPREEEEIGAAEDEDLERD